MKKITMDDWKLLKDAKDRLRSKRKHNEELVQLQKTCDSLERELKEYKEKNEQLGLIVSEYRVMAREIIGDTVVTTDDEPLIKRVKRTENVTKAIFRSKNDVRQAFIFDTIEKCFQKDPSQTIIDETQIIEQGGVWARSQKKMISREELRRYFAGAQVHKEGSAGEKFFSVHESPEKTWLVALPSWLRSNRH